MGKIRKPAVAGRFYPETKEGIEKQMKEMFSKVKLKSKEKDPIAILCPHAGYAFSGKTAAHAFSRIKDIGKGATFIIIGPNHQSVSSEVSVYPEGEWETPLGNAKIDSELAKSIFNNDIVMDESAHEFENSIEVQIPFLQYLFGDDFSFVPITMLNQSHQVAKKVGQLVAQAVKKSKKKVIIIASSDLSHYVPKTLAEKADKPIIDAIVSLDENELYKAVDESRVSVCGYGSIAATIVASKILEANKAELLSYTTSAETTKDTTTVVSYCAMEFLK